MNPSCQRALIVIDIQNDYFPDGKFPLWQPEAVLARIEQAIAQARCQDMPVIFVQHVADARSGLAPFFNPETPGVALHPRLLQAAPDAPIVIKRFADSFLETNLAALLAARGVGELLICGMMTQNCVTHTAISTAAAPYRVSVLADCCTSVSQMIHLIALNGVAPRVTVCDAARVGL